MVVSRAVAVSSPSSTATAVTRADVVAFGASMLCYPRSGGGPPQGRDRPILLSALRSPAAYDAWLVRWLLGHRLGSGRGRGRSGVAVWLGARSRCCCSADGC